MDKDKGTEKTTKMNTASEEREAQSGGASMAVGAGERGRESVERAEKNDMEAAAGVRGGESVKVAAEARVEVEERAVTAGRVRSSGERSGNGGGGEVERKRSDGAQVAAAERPGAHANDLGSELVVLVELEGPEKLTMIELLKGIELTCGRVVGCRARDGGRWEITMGCIRGKEKLLDGFKMKNTRVMGSEIARNIKVVSFLHLPVYVTDQQIHAKLRAWRVEPASDIKRKKWQGTNILDGTRFLKVKFSEDVTSLPYSVKFDTLEGHEYFRVLHDNQRKLCRKCLQPGHILRECPEFTCFKCLKQGHYAAECRGEDMEEEEEEDEEEEADEEVRGTEDEMERDSASVAGLDGEEADDVVVEETSADESGGGEKEKEGARQSAPALKPARGEERMGAGSKASAGRSGEREKERSRSPLNRLSSSVESLPSAQREEKTGKETDMKSDEDDFRGEAKAFKARSIPVSRRSLKAKKGS